jgi:hypothetical protein
MPGVPIDMEIRPLASPFGLVPGAQKAAPAKGLSSRYRKGKMKKKKKENNKRKRPPPKGSLEGRKRKINK